VLSIKFANGDDEMEQDQKATHVRWDEIDVEAMSPQIGRQFIVGSNMMIARVLLKKGAVVPLHRHVNEQITYILEGALQFLVGGRQVIVRSGEVLCIPPNLPHEAMALEDTVDVDIFTPPRQDWINKDDSYLRQTVAQKEES
jgi:quercetin dioxygenase-like cupin family protein